MIETAFAGFAQLGAGVIGAALFLAITPVGKTVHCRQPIADHLKEGDFFKEGHTVHKARTCIAPESLSATLARISIGALMVAHLERRKSVAVKTQAAPVQSN